MKASIHSLARVVLVLIILSAWGCTGDDSSAVPEPFRLGRTDVSAYLAIPSLETALQGVVDLTDAIQPNTLTLKKLKVQVGNMLGDPELSNLNPEEPLLLVAFRGGAATALPPVVAFIPVSEAAPYTQSLSRLGMQTKYEDGLVLATTAIGMLETTDSLRAIYDRFSDAEIPAGARLYFQLGHLLEDYGVFLEEQIDSLLSMFAMLPLGAGSGPGGQEGREGIQKLLKAELKAFLALARQCDDVQVDLTVGEVGVKIDKIVVAKSGSALSTLFENTAALQPTSFGTLESGGIMSGVFAVDAEGSAHVAKDILDELAKDPDCATLVTPEITALFEDVSGWWPERGSMSMSSSQDSPFNINAVMEVMDADKYLAVMEKFTNVAKPGTPLHEIYMSMGMDMQPSIERDARTYDGVSVHRFKMFETTDVADDLLKSLPADLEIAFINGVAVMAYTTGELNRLIDKIKGEANAGEMALQAVQTFGAGRQVYLDYDLIALAKSLGGTVQGADGMFGKMSTGFPLVCAMTFTGNRALMQLQLPIEFFRQIGQRND